MRLFYINVSVNFLNIFNQIKMCPYSNFYFIDLPKKGGGYDTQVLVDEPGEKCSVHVGSQYCGRDMSLIVVNFVVGMGYGYF